MKTEIGQMPLLVALVLSAVLTGPWAGAQQTWVTDLDALGRTDKLRVLVDKVLMRANGWVMTEDHVRQIAEAGFNVVSPRLGNDDMDEVRKIARAAQKYGIFHLPWMRGTLAAKTGPKLVWSSGKEQDLCTPNSDEFWEWTTGLILEYARISVETPSLFGVFLDYENYAANKQGNAYSLSYDDETMSAFAAQKGLELPTLGPAERYPWLIEQGLHDEFSEYQIGTWRERCRTLRQAVDSINPRFQFCIYPAPGTLFMVEAAYPEWATPMAPLILADATTYGRPSGFLPHHTALTANRTMLHKNIVYSRGIGVPCIYLGGIDPVVKGADPEFNGKNAVMISEITDGYWIFYEGPTYGQEDHAANWKWFTWANRAIASGRFEVQHEKRETPDTWGVAEVERETDKPQVALYGMKPRMHAMVDAAGEFEVHELRGNSLEYLRQLDAIVLQNFNVALPTSDEFSRALRTYVEEGGGLMLAHDTAWFMDSPFPEIAVRDIPTQKMEAGRHVVETDVEVSQAHPALGDIETGVQFYPEFRDHMIFKPGAEGTVIIRNVFGDPVYVVGEIGKGRVVFSGSYYGYNKDLEGEEREVFESLLRWLGGK